MNPGNYRWSEDALITFTSQATDIRRPAGSTLTAKHRVTIFHTDTMTLDEAGKLLALNGSKWLGVTVVVDPEVYPLQEVNDGR